MGVKESWYDQNGRRHTVDLAVMKTTFPMYTDPAKRPSRSIEHPDMICDRTPHQQPLTSEVETALKPKPPDAPRLEIPRFDRNWFLTRKKVKNHAHTTAVSSCRTKGATIQWASARTLYRAADLIDCGCKAVRCVAKRSKHPMVLVPKSSSPKGNEDPNAMCKAIQESRALTHLDLHGYEFTRNICQGFVDSLRSNWTLKYLDLSECSLQSEGACLLADVLRLDQSIQHVNLSSNNLDAEASLKIADALCTNKVIQHLDLSYNTLGPRGGTSIAGMLKENQTLQYLNLSSNSLGMTPALSTTTEACVALASALKTNRGVQELNLSHNEISAEGGQALAKALESCRNYTLQSLILAGNGLEQPLETGTTPVLKTIERALRWTTTRSNQASARRVRSALTPTWVVVSTSQQCADSILEGNVAVQWDPDAAPAKRNLSRSSSPLGSSGASPNDASHPRSSSPLPDDAEGLVSPFQDVGTFDLVVEALLRDSGTTHLDLADAGLDLIGNFCSSLAFVLQRNHTLLHLDISRSTTGIDGVEKISEALKVNHTLQNLIMRDIGLDSPGSHAIAKALKSNRGVLHLDLSHNHIGVEGGTAIARGLMRNFTLRNVNLSYNALGADGSRAVAGALRMQSIVLEHLDLSHNRIGPGGGLAIAKALEGNSNNSLITILLAGNGLSQVEIRAVCDALRLSHVAQSAPAWLDSSHHPIWRPSSEGGLTPKGTASGGFVPSYRNPCDCSRVCQACIAKKLACAECVEKKRALCDCALGCAACIAKKAALTPRRDVQKSGSSRRSNSGRPDSYRKSVEYFPAHPDIKDLERLVTRLM